MQNKRKLLAVALFATLGLTACDEVVAKPTNYNDKIVEGVDEVVNNEMAKVYDSIRKGALAGDVLDEFLYQYAVSAFGPYNAVTNNSESKTLKEIARLIKSKWADTKDIDTLDVAGLTGSDADAFVKSHKAYWTLNDKGERIHYAADNTAEKVNDDASADALEYARVLTKWNTIEDRIAKALYSAVAGNSSYTTRNVFQEKEYIYSLYGNMKKVAKPADAVTYTGLIWPEVEDVDVFNQDKKVEDINGTLDTILHRDNYQQHYELTDSTESSNNTITYVEDDIIPTIYRTLLTEQYLYDESYQLLGRSYARKVNVIKVTSDNTHAKGAGYLMKAFIREKIFNANNTPVTLDDFKVLSSAHNGAFMADAQYASSDEYKLWQAAAKDTTLFNEVLIDAKDGSKYIAGTEYGNMMEKYDKISDNPALSQNESDFTDNGKYVKEVGKEIKTREILTKDNTTTGWFIKNGGLTDLPESIRSRLFNISVANALNRTTEQKAAENRTAIDGSDADKDFNNYVTRINGKCYLKVDKSERGADPRYDVLFQDGDNYYIVQIEEAASTSALSKTETNSYLNMEGYGAYSMEGIVNEVCTIVADSESYRTLAKKHFLEEAKLKYHDTVIYDYFKSNFPELFD